MDGPLRIFRHMSGPFHLNTYFLICPGTRETVIIDPGDRAEILLDIVKEKELIPRAMLMTHGHADQDFSAGRFKENWDVPYCIHREDEIFFRNPEIRAATRKAVGLPPPYPADLTLDHGQRLPLGSLFLEVIHTPGHTPGSCCFLCRGQLFTGDTLFVGEAGRTDLPGGDLDLMIRSIKERILPLAPDTGIYPAHHHRGTPVSSTLAREMADNIYITDFILDP